MATEVRLVQELLTDVHNQRLSSKAHDTAQLEFS